MRQRSLMIGSLVVQPVMLVIAIHVFCQDASRDKNAEQRQAKAAAPAPDTSEWKVVKAPQVWKSPPKGKLGYGWYRCFVSVPETWKGRNFELFVEPVDDAREYYLNGVKVGAAGSMPPQFRSGLGDPDRHHLAESALRPGQTNVFAIRAFDSDGRGGFNVAAPVLFAGDEAIRLEGDWEHRAGDNPEWGKLDPQLKIAEKLVIAKVQPTADVMRQLRKLEGEEGPLSPAESLSRFKTSEGLAVDLALSEPQIGQPLSIKFDERGRLWVMNYLQYPNPAGLKMVSRDKFLRSVYDKMPAPPPNHFRGTDKITIHEDQNADGVFDRHSVFVEGLSLATSFEFDRDGVWVLNPPYLLFYPDKNHDDVPDGDPIVHLEGFGIEDSHSVTNNLRWGPDGWLYATQGSTVTGNIRRYGSQDKPVHSMGQLVWRYHPTEQRYEIFAEGGGNSFGVEFDAKGRVFSGHNGGDTRGFHYVQGGYYQKGFGKHGSLSNPYAFGYFPMMQHHSVPRFTHTFVIYEGGALGSSYAGKLFGVAPLQGHTLYSRIEPQGSTFKTSDIGLALSTNDSWFRPVDIQAGPDGALYVADMYEQRIDHASHYQGRITRDTGRIYRIRAASSPAGTPAVNLNQRSTPDLVRMLSHENKWARQTAQRLLRQRGDASAVNELKSQLSVGKGQLALESFWGLNGLAALDDAVILSALAHEDPYVRVWSVRLACDGRRVSPAVQQALVELAYRDPNVEVRSQLACSSRRLPAADGLPIVEKLLGRSEDDQDPHVPSLLWWSIETHATAERDAVIKVLESKDLWSFPLVRNHILERLMRRLAQSGIQKDLLACARLLEIAPDKDQVDRLMTGFEKAFEGRSLVGLPQQLVDVMAKRGGGSLALRLRQSDTEAIKESFRLIADNKTKPGERAKYIEIIGQVRPRGGDAVLLGVMEQTTDQIVQAATLSALQSFDQPAIGERVVSLLGRFSADNRESGISLLVSRAGWTKTLMQAVERGVVPPSSISKASVRRAALHRDEGIAQSIKKHWGEIQSTNIEALRSRMDQVSKSLSAGTGNPYKGRAVYRGSCGKCHVLFEDGGRIGPELTAYKRDDLPTMLVNIVNPSLQIREGFESFLVVTADGRTLNGFVADQDNRVVVLRTADGSTLVIPRDEIDEMQASPISMMPEGLLDNFDDQQLRDLFAFLRSTQPLPD